MYVIKKPLFNINDQVKYTSVNNSGIIVDPSIGLSEPPQTIIGKIIQRSYYFQEEGIGVFITGEMLTGWFYVLVPKEEDYSLYVHENRLTLI